jgi:hypothetical protein
VIILGFSIRQSLYHEVDDLGVKIPVEANNGHWYLSKFECSQTVKREPSPRAGPQGCVSAFRAPITSPIPPLPPWLVAATSIFKPLTGKDELSPRFSHHPHDLTKFR